MSGRHLVLERTAHRLRLALDHLDQRARGARWPSCAELPLAHGADAGADDGGKFPLRQAELVPRQAGIAVAGDDLVHDGAGFLAGEVVARFHQAFEKVIHHPPLFYFLRHDGHVPQWGIGVKVFPVIPGRA
jgi:Ser/Thr protein kinase RdoA (MazF antagonist)